MNLKRDEETRVYTNITPKMAKEFMEHNAEFNRKPSMAKVYEYADLMKNGKWNEEISIIQDPIVFSKDGTLINGQHRCMAIIKADVDINSMVVYGAPSELYQFFDGVKPRKAAEFIDGINKNSIAALAKMWYALECGNCPVLGTGEGKLNHAKSCEITYPSRTDIVNTAQAHYDELDYYLKAGWKIATGLSKNSTFSYVLMLIDYVGRGEMLDEFIEDFSKKVSDFAPNTACKMTLARSVAMGKKMRGPLLIGSLLQAYEYFRDDNTDAVGFNKQRFYISRYDRYLAEERERRRNGENVSF